MKKVLLSFFLVVILLPPAIVVSQSYQIPGKNYNNIGIEGKLLVDINMTLYNSGPFPKFVIVNPRYSVYIYKNGTFHLVIKSISQGLYYVENVSKYSMNYRIGFWIMPYEILKVRFQIEKTYPFYINVSNYVDLCDSKDQITYLEYNNGSLSGKISSSNDIGAPICGVLYPQLINRPMIINFNRLLPLADKYVKMVNYTGRITLILENVPNDNDAFASYFAVAVPLVFKNAKMYKFVPNYTMTFNQYRSFIENYTGIKERKEVPSSTVKLFALTSKLISSSLQTKVPPTINYYQDFPIWIVDLMGHSVQLQYMVKWMGNVTLPQQECDVCGEIRC